MSAGRFGGENSSAKRAMADHIRRPGLLVAAGGIDALADSAELGVTRRDPGVDQRNLDAGAAISGRQPIKSHGGRAPAERLRLG